jgi:hypothetical protein
VGRWLGYSTAVLFAMLSLYQIIKTFKRVLLFKVYVSKTPVEQEEMVDALENRQSAGARMLARVMTTMRLTPNDIAALQESGGNEATSPFEAKAASSHTIRLRRGFSRSHTMIMPASVPEHAAAVRQFATINLPGRNTSPSPSGKETSAHPLHSTGAAVGNRTFRRSASIRQQEGTSTGLGLTTSIEKIKEDRENSLCVSIAQDIQRLEVSAIGAAHAVGAAHADSAC